MNGSAKSRQDEQIEELLELLEEMQAESDRKDHSIAQLQKQRDDSLALAERLKSENRAGDVQALESDLRHKNESLQSANRKLQKAGSTIGEYRDKLRRTEKALFVLCGYALMTTVLAAMQSEVFTSDFKAFWSAIWTGIQRASELLLTAGKFAAQAGDKLPNETAALLTHWLLFLAVTVAITAGTGVLLFLAAQKICKLHQENCLDEISVMVSVISITLVAYFGAEIKALLQMNLIGILLLVQALYVAVRSYVRGCKRARGYL